MKGRHLKDAATVFMVLAVFIAAPAASLVGYQVTTDCAEDWNVLVNDQLIVRHRPTGFERCFYSGSLNSIVVEGANTVALVDMPRRNPAHNPEPGGCLKLEIRLVPDYRGGRGYKKTVTLLEHSGSESTNLQFFVGQPVSPLVGGFVVPGARRRFFAGRRALLVFGLYALLVNVHGFILVAKDRAEPKRPPRRRSSSGFGWNAVLGGGIGQLAAMLLLKHNMDKPALVIGMPALTLLLFALVHAGDATGWLDRDLGLGPPARRLVASLKDGCVGLTNFGCSKKRVEDELQSRRESARRTGME
ncbi:MAG: hypothetical protein ACOX9C_05630 [Kiritimatiellia bacterium]|jgi:uncharacterized membrane protein YsdA (DUF1294 family)